MVRIPTHRAPTHPGEMLKEEFLVPMGISQRELADKIGVPYQRINEIVNGRRGITSSTALRLAKFFEVSPEFWMNLQLRWELYHAQKSEAEVLERIHPIEVYKTEKINRSSELATSGSVSSTCSNRTEMYAKTRKLVSTEF